MSITNQNFSKLKDIIFPFYLKRLMFIWLAIFLISNIFDNTFVKLLLITYSGYFPFISIFLWLSKSESGKIVRAKIKLWHWSVFISFVLILYNDYAQYWSYQLLNELFKLEPTKFPNTDMIIRILLAPVNLIYYPEATKQFAVFAFLGAILVTPFFPLAIFAGITYKATIQVIGSFIHTSFWVMIFMGAVSNMNLILEDLVLEIALHTDFYENHRCKDEWSKSINSVVFLSVNKVYVYFPNKIAEEKFQVLDCNYY